MGVYTKDYFLLGVEIDFHEQPLAKTMTGDEEFSFLYEGLANPWKHETGQMVQLFDGESGVLTIGYAIAVKGDDDETIGTHLLTPSNLMEWREKFEPIVNEYTSNLFHEAPKPEFRLFTHFW